MEARCSNFNGSPCVVFVVPFSEHRPLGAKPATLTRSQGEPGEAHLGQAPCTGLLGGQTRGVRCMRRPRHGGSPTNKKTCTTCNGRQTNSGTYIHRDHPKSNPMFRVLLPKIASAPRTLGHSNDNFKNGIVPSVLRPDRRLLFLCFLPPRRQPPRSRLSSRPHALSTRRLIEILRGVSSIKFS